MHLNSGRFAAPCRKTPRRFAPAALALTCTAMTVVTVYKRTPREKKAQPAAITGPAVVQTAKAPAPAVRRCQWIENDARPWRYCAAPAAPGRVYCTAHSKRAYMRKSEVTRLPGGFQ